MFSFKCLVPLQMLIFMSTWLEVAALMNISVITSFTTSLLTTMALMEHNQFVYPIHINRAYSLPHILSRKNYVRTVVIVNTKCKRSAALLAAASAGQYFNKTYQWLLWGAGQDIEQILPMELKYVGPNAQITYINSSHNGYAYWDVHSKGRHLKSNLEVHLIAYKTNETFHRVQDIFELQSIRNRGQFNGLTLRGASVIDQEDVTTNQQIEAILSRPTKDSGVAAFIKYHYELLGVLRERFNFTVHFRNSRGWAGRLGNTTFRLGLLGIIMRNEADVAASGAFNRLNRFAEFDYIHQSWKFASAFVYRFTPELDANGKAGNFLAPFNKDVWLLTLGTLAVVTMIWLLIEGIHRQRIFKNQQKRAENLQETLQNSNMKSIENGLWTDLALKTFGAACQQGMEPIPTGLPSRAIVFITFMFSLVMYNYYTSSVVGGLLSSSEKGPATIDEIISSPLKISFEDIGYYKVLFRESKSPVIARLISRKLSQTRASNELPVYTQIDQAVPYLKSGGFAFHCELVDAYPLVAEQFDANEICALREVSGLMEIEILNWIVPKNSQYTEIFKTAMCSAKEAGLVQRILSRRQFKKPACQALYTVYPVSLSGVLSAFFTLLGGYVLALFALGAELIIAKWQTYVSFSIFNYTQ